MTEQQTAEMTAEDRDKALRKAYGTATARLRDEHRDEFNGYYSEAAKELGVEWSPRKSAEEKAAEEMERLLTEYPHLRQRIAPEAVQRAETGPQYASPTPATEQPEG